MTNEPLAVCRECTNLTEGACRHLWACVKSMPDELVTLRAENARLREALERIANYEESMMHWQDIALAALTAKEPAR